MYVSLELGREIQAEDINPVVIAESHGLGDVSKGANKAEMEKNEERMDKSSPGERAAKVTEVRVKMWQMGYTDTYKRKKKASRSREHSDKCS